LAASSFPHTKTSCSPGTLAGSTITSQFIVFSAFTTFVSGKAPWICSPSESVLEPNRLGGIAPRPRAWRENGHSHIAEHFLGDRHLLQYAELLTELLDG
jgi:hypothetical protein